MSPLTFIIISTAAVLSVNIFFLHHSRNELLKFRMKHEPIAEAAWSTASKVMTAMGHGAIVAVLLSLTAWDGLKSNGHWDVISIGFVQLLFAGLGLPVFHRRVVLVKNSVLYVTMLGRLHHYVDEDLLGGVSSHNRFNSGSTTIKFPKGRIVVNDQMENQYRVVTALIQRIALQTSRFSPCQRSWLG